MKKLLFVDSCIRGSESRTLKIAEAFLSSVRGYEIARVRVDGLPLVPLGLKELSRRGALVDAGNYSDPLFACAKQFAEADLIVIASPLWDMGIPAKLKTYLENVSVEGIAFRAMENGDCVGICRAEETVFLTTRGMDIADGDPMEQASPYLKAISRFFGIERFETVSAYGLDMVSPEEAERRVDAAAEEARALAEALCQ